MISPSVKHIPANSELHKKIISEFRNRMKLSVDAQRQEREKKWQDAEDTFMMYVKETEADQLRKQKSNSGMPQYVTVAVPYSYAMLLTAHTYLTSVFLARNPVFQVQGRHGESQNSEMVIEALLDYQLTSGLNMAPLFVWLLDPGKYGHGILGHYWDEEQIPMSQYVDEPVRFLGMPIPGKTQRKLQTVMQTGYVGNRYYNVRPQDFFPDPRVPMWRFQEGEYCIVFDKVGWNKIARNKASGRYYNTGLLDKEKYPSFADVAESSPRVTLPNDDFSTVDQLPGKHPSLVDLYEFYWELIPSEWGFSASNVPEKWVFTIANKSIVLSAQPLGLAHGKYPFDVLVNEIDGYSLFTRSTLEILDPLNKTMEWLLNSHFYNVRAALNNMFAADPSRVNIRDIEQPEPGKLIRLRPAAFGQDIRTMIAQFQVQDVTRSNLNDMDVVGQLAQRMIGVTDNVMGMVNTSGRKTATEVRTSTSFGVNRLKTTCEWFSATGFSPLTQKMIASSQQLLAIERKLRVVGDLAQWGQRYIDVGPAAIQGMYDFVPIDGSLPVDRFAQANLWQQILGGMQRLPQVMMAYDVPKIFAFVAQLAGLKNIQQFRVQVVPDAALQGQAQAGNMVPMRANPNEPGQVPGMGATG